MRFVIITLTPILKYSTKLFISTINLIFSSSWKFLLFWCQESRTAEVLCNFILLMQLDKREIAILGKKLNYSKHIMVRKLILNFPWTQYISCTSEIEC